LTDCNLLVEVVEELLLGLILNIERSMVSKNVQNVTHKATTEFYRNRNRLDGFYPYCRSCLGKTKRSDEFMLKNGIKKCSVCKEDKQESLYYRNTRTSDKLQRVCKSCMLKANTIYSYKRYHNDIDFRLRKSLRTRVRLAIKSNWKFGSTLKLLGCTIDELKIHLQNKFREGMTWQNFGFGETRWNIDHVIPCAAFNLSDPVQQQQCFHYTNLQPLWQKDNLQKGCR